LLERGDAVVAHVADADRGILDGAVTGADGPPFFLQGPHDVLGALPRGQLEAGHRPGPPALARQEFDALRRRPLFDRAAHLVMPPPPCLDAALLVDAL